MLFTSSLFLVFLAILLCAYSVTPQKFRWFVLLVGSMVFYAFAGPIFLLYILTTIIVTYITTMLILRLHNKRNAILDQVHSSADKKKVKDEYKKYAKKYLTAGLFIVLGILAMVKYTDFVIANTNAVLGWVGADRSFGFMRFALPMGISFYTFQTVGYLIDVYREKALIQQNPLKLALFVSFFPQVVQGPISRFGELSKTLYNGTAINSHSFFRGAQRVLWGFFKKLVIADRLWPALSHLTTYPEEFYGVYYLLSIGLYAVILFCDFTGGIDITIGVAEMFGVKLPENFNRPFYSRSIQEYWQRWHMTMYSWFRDYVFYPMSVGKRMLNLSKSARKIVGDRIGKRLPIHISLLWVWFLTGLWHGATWNFIAWGLANGIVIMVSLELQPLYMRFHKRFISAKENNVYRAFQIFRTFWLMNMIRSFDIYEGVINTFRMMGSVVTRFNLLSFLQNGILPLGLPVSDYVAAAAGLAVVFYMSYLSRDGVDFRDKMAMSYPWQIRHLIYGIIIFMTIILGAYGFGYDARQFIYNQF